MTWPNLLIAILIVGTVAIAGWCVGRLIDLAWERRWLRQRRPGGFEVKLNAGEEPVTEKKENDHG